ncbi:MAG: hypothetical protein VW235_14370, partial [Rhodospirillaceae bacterium]
RKRVRIKLLLLLLNTKREYNLQRNIMGKEETWHLTLTIEVKPKNLLRDKKHIPSFWTGYISGVAGHKVISSQYKEVE